MRFLVDAQLPPALARWIDNQEHIAEHVADVGLTDASDREIWQYAASVGAVIVTKDADFARRRSWSMMDHRSSGYGSGIRDVLSCSGSSAAAFGTMWPRSLDTRC